MSIFLAPMRRRASRGSGGLGGFDRRPNEGRHRVLVALVGLALVAATVPGCGGAEDVKPAVAFKGSIVFASPAEGDHADIYVLDAQGTHRLAENGHTTLSYPAWSPDGAQIAYITSQWQLAVVKRDGSGGATLTPKTSDSSLRPLRPAWLPDGNISFLVNGKLDVLRPDGSGVRVLTLPHFFETTAYAWSPDGKRIVYGCTVLRGQEVCLFDLKSGKSRTLLTPPVKFDALDWSPNGKQIIAGVWGTPAELWVFGADGSGLRALTQRAQRGAAGYPAWSPDGTMLVYDTLDETSETPLTLWVMNADGTGAKELLSGIDAVRPNWTAR